MAESFFYRIFVDDFGEIYLVHSNKLDVLYNSVTGMIDDSTKMWEALLSSEDFDIDDLVINFD